MNKDILMNLKRGLGKRVMPSVLAGALLFGAGGTTVDAFSFDAPEQSYNDFIEYKGIKIFINGRYVEFNDDLGYPIAINGRTYIPVRVVSETFNSYVYWRDWDQSVFVNKYGSQVRIELGSKNLEVIDDLSDSLKKKTITMDAKAFAQNGRTYIPLRALFESFGLDVTWDGVTQTVYVKDKYEENTKYIDFKDYKVIEMKDLDLTKNYSKILYDGEEIDKEYLNILKNSNEYKIIVEDDKINVFSYQFLFDINNIYRITTERKNNTEDSETYYSLFSINQEEVKFRDKITFIDDRYSFLFSMNIDNILTGGNSIIVSAGDKEYFDKIDKVVENIVLLAKTKEGKPEEMVKIVNDELKKIITYDKEGAENLTFNGNIYSALVDPKRTVCQGYSLSFKYIMDKLGIPCVVVTGKNMNAGINGRDHSWNEVYINGEWKLVDVSANDLRDNNSLLLVDPSIVDYYEVTDEDQNNLDLVKLTLKLGNNY